MPGTLVITGTLITTGMLRREAVALAQKASTAGAEWRYTRGKLQLRSILLGVEHHNLRIRSLGLPEMNALGQAALSLRRDVVPGFVTHQQFVKILYAAQHTLRVKDDFAALNLVMSNGLYRRSTHNARDRKAFFRATGLADTVLQRLIPDILCTMDELTAGEAAAVIRWFYTQHFRLECARGMAVPVELEIIQVLDGFVEKLAHPAVYPHLTVTETSHVVVALSTLRMTPDHLFDSLAIHTMDTLLPQLQESIRGSLPVADAGDHEGGEALVVRKQKSLVRIVEEECLQLVVAAFSKVAEMGRVPVSDVLYAVAVHVRDLSCLQDFSKRGLIRLSYLSTALSRKWGIWQGRRLQEEEVGRADVGIADSAGVGEEGDGGGGGGDDDDDGDSFYAPLPTSLPPEQQAVLREVMLSIGEEAVRRATSPPRRGHWHQRDELKKSDGEQQFERAIDTRLLRNLVEASALDPVVSYVQHLLVNPSALDETAHRQLVEVAFSFARALEGLGYREQIVDEGELGDDDDAEVPPVPAQDTEAESADAADGRCADQAARLRELIIQARDEVMLPFGRTFYRMRESSKCVYTFSRLSELTPDLLCSMVEVTATQLTAEVAAQPEAKRDTALQVAPHVLSTLFHSIAHAGLPDGLPKTDLFVHFDVICGHIAAGRLDITNRKPHHAVAIVWALAKLGYTEGAGPTAVLSRLLEVFNEDGIRRLSVASAAMIVQALAKFPASRQTAATVSQIVTFTADKMERAGCRSLLSVDLIALGLSVGRWDKEIMINPLFALSKAFVNSGSAPAALRRPSGKSLSRLLWSHSVVMVRHTTLCTAIVTALEDPEYVVRCSMDAMSVTSSLVAMSRLRLNSVRAVGNLCSRAAALTQEMNPISLSDIVQAVTELGLPSKTLQLVLARRAVESVNDFTPKQAASFVWNMSRAGLVPSSVRGESGQQALNDTYIVLVGAAIQGLADLDLRFKCRVMQTLGFLYGGSNDGEMRELWRSYPAPLLAAIMPEMHEVWVKDLANVLWGLAVLKHRPCDDDVAVLNHYRTRQNFDAADRKRVDLWDAFVSPEDGGAGLVCPSLPDPSFPKKKTK